MKFKVVAISNQKGGVGKTTTAINIAASVARLGQKTILIDCDPQANATSGLGIANSSDGANLYQILTGIRDINEAIAGSSIENLYVISASTDLAGLEAEQSIQGKGTRNFLLKHAVNRLNRDIDFIFIDCPPSLGLLTVNALAASSSVLIPLQCEYYALEGLSLLIQTIRRVKSVLNPMLHIEGIVLTMFDQRTRLSYQVANEVKRHFRQIVYHTVIPRNIKLSEAPSHGSPIISYAPSSKGGEAYMRLAREFLKKQGVSMR